MASLNYMSSRAVWATLDSVSKKKSHPTGTQVPLAAEVGQSGPATPPASTKHKAPHKGGQGMCLCDTSSQVSVMPEATIQSSRATEQ